MIAKLRVSLWRAEGTVGQSVLIVIASEAKQSYTLLSCKEKKLHYMRGLK